MKDYSKVLKRRVRDTVHEYARITRDRVKDEWSRYNDQSLGKAQISALPAIADINGIITQQLVAMGQKAWILEYGRGSLMESSSAENPWLDEYVSSPNFNKWRKTHGFAITGREKGEYFDLDGTPLKSTGTLMGVNLEEWHSTKEYYPIPPLKIIQTVLYGDGDSGLLHELREALFECVWDVYAQNINEYAEKEIKIKL